MLRRCLKNPPNCWSPATRFREFVSPNSARLPTFGLRHQDQGCCAVSPTLATRLLSFAYQKGLANDARFFTFNDRYAHRIVSRAGAAVGIKKPDGVGWVHLLRHSGAIERLRVTRHPPGVQAQLGHRSPFMTYRYWRTLQAEEALEASQIGVELTGV